MMRAGECGEAAGSLVFPWPGATAVNIPIQMGRCLGLLTLLALAHGVANAQGEARWSWQEPHAKVLPTGDLEWAPRPFAFRPGASVRYIDFDSGDDANDGLSKQTPWKHHPWDPQAGGQAAACKGVHTYVFKQGVDYRGELNAHESGTADAPDRPDPRPVVGPRGRRSSAARRR